MDIKRIYFDMDGVLADFERGVAELAGITPINQKDKTPAQADGNSVEVMVYGSKDY